MMNRQATSRHWERSAVGLRPHFAKRCVPARQHAKHQTLSTTFLIVSSGSCKSVWLTVTYGFQLIEAVRYTRGIKFGSEVIGSDDISRNARERTSGHPNKQALPRYWRLDDFFRTHSAALLFFPLKRIDNLLIDRNSNRIRNITVRVSLRNYNASLFEMAFVHKPARRFGAIRLAALKPTDGHRRIIIGLT